MAEILFTHVIGINFFNEQPTGPDRFVEWRFGSGNPVATGSTVHSGRDAIGPHGPCNNLDSRL